MLKPEAAKKQLEQWSCPNAIEERFLPRIAQLPSSLKTIAYALLDRDAQGNEVSWKDQEEISKSRPSVYPELDALPAGKRLQLFEQFFPKIAEKVEQGWQFLKKAPYQIDFARKAFRAPRHPEISLVTRTERLKKLIQIDGRFRDDVITIPWLAAWAPHLDQYGGDDQEVVGRLLASVIDAGGPLADEVFDTLIQSGRNEHEIGGMGRHVTRGLLLSSRPEAWEFMEKMLLAAQRQEGLRQSILETVDEAHPEAFRRMLRLIMEHDLARFSAVVRALNVWLGYQWDSASTKTVNDTIEKLLRFLDDENARNQALEGKKAEDVFLALWSMAFEDVFLSMPAAGKLLKHPKVEHRYVAALHLSHLGLEQAHPFRMPALEDEDLRVAMAALQGITWDEEAGPDILSDEDGLFEKLERLCAKIPEKPTMLRPLVWPWTGGKIHRQNLAGYLVDALGARPPTRLIPYLSALGRWHRQAIVKLLSKQKKWDKLTREALLDLAGDSNSDVRQAAVNALAKAPLQLPEVKKLEGYLTRKTSDLRRGVIGLLVQQKGPEALACADRLLASKDAQQRLAGLEILRQLAESGRERAACQERAEAYSKQRKQFSKEERTQLDAIGNAGREVLTLDNALGLFNPAERTPALPPKHRHVPFITDAAIACLKSLENFVKEHEEIPITVQTPEGVETKLLGELNWVPRGGGGTLEKEQSMPLRELWEQWRDQRPKSLRDPDGLELVRAWAWAGVSEWDWDSWKEWAKKSATHKRLVEALSGGQQPFRSRAFYALIEELVGAIIMLDPPANTIDYILDALETAYSLVPGELLTKLTGLSDSGADDDDDDQADWRAAEPFRLWPEHLWKCSVNGAFQVTPQQWARYWQLMHWRDEPVPGARRDRSEPELFQKGYAEGAANVADWYDQLLGPRPAGERFSDLGHITDNWMTKETQDYLKRFPEVREVVDRCRERILEIELARGEERTPATRPALELGSLYGTDTLVRILTALGKQPFKVEWGWSSASCFGRTATLTHLASIVYPQATDTVPDFVAKLNSAVKSGQIAEERVLDLGFLAAQWARIIEAFLDWPGFREGLYWFLAHMSYTWHAGQRAAIGAEMAPAGEQDATSRRSAWDRLIMERTPLTEEEREAGAVDVAWFQRTYAELTPKRWLAMAQAARLAANSYQARHAQFVADVLLGKASRKELIRGIRTKKLKDYVRLLGLLPLAKGPKHDSDLAERYRVLQEYRRYAKGLSSMTKEGAMRAVDIGMQNLARTAGYADPLRLEWAMEADSVKDLARGPVSVTKDGVTVTLALDDLGRPALTSRRGDKELKAIPPAIKKDKSIAVLTARVTDLRRQASRIRQSLENAMCRGDAFSGSELAQLCEHAILAPLLERVVLVGDGIIGYPDKKGKALRDHRGKLEPIKKDETLRIAHSYDLIQTGKWDAWQHECFQAERVQPFKQVFRELYVVTKQEKADDKRSQRYAGQQVNPSAAYGLWGTRGWNTKEGVWKSFYDLGITASVDFNYGITTPLEVEGLTLDTVSFLRKDELLKLTEVPPRVFSEVMRDLDLVVSVAHRGGVDREASASSVEMRSNLLRETCQLLKFQNVRIKDSHALVDGELGKYSVHLGSATVHKLPGGALCIVPVHAQHRGRLFLPFADDDPKTAEVISKVLLLARDAEIQDPTILDQLRRI